MKRFLSSSSLSGKCVFCFFFFGWVERSGYGGGRNLDGERGRIIDFGVVSSIFAGLGLDFVYIRLRPTSSGQPTLLSSFYLLFLLLPLFKEEDRGGSVYSASTSVRTVLFCCCCCCFCYSWCFCCCCFSFGCFSTSYCG